MLVLWLTLVLWVPLSVRMLPRSRFHDIENGNVGVVMASAPFPALAAILDETASRKVSNAVLLPAPLVT